MSRFALRHMATVCGCVFASVLLVTPAEAAIVFGSGKLSGTDAEDVHMDGGQSGLTILGTVGPLSHQVLFSQPNAAEEIRTGGTGVAFIEATTQGPGDLGFTSIRIQLASGDLFSAFEMNPHFTSSGLSIKLFADGVELTSPSNTFISQNGQNQFFVLGTEGQTFRYIDLVAPMNTLASVRQIYIGGITTAPAEVPEPSTWVMLTMGLAIAFGIAHRKRASQQLAVGGLA